MRGGQWLEGLRLLERKNRTEVKAEKQNKTLPEGRRQKMEQKTGTEDQTIDNRKQKTEGGTEDRAEEQNKSLTEMRRRSGRQNKRQQKAED